MRRSCTQVGAPVAGNVAGCPGAPIIRSSTARARASKSVYSQGGAGGESGTVTPPPREEVEKFEDGNDPGVVLAEEFVEYVVEDDVKGDVDEEVEDDVVRVRVVEVRDVEDDVEEDVEDSESGSDATAPTGAAEGPAGAAEGLCPASNAELPATAESCPSVCWINACSGDK